jgi:hypothetical protein
MKQTCTVNRPRRAIQTIFLGKSTVLPEVVAAVDTVPPMLSKYTTEKAISPSELTDGDCARKGV